MNDETFVFWLFGTPLLCVCYCFDYHISVFDMPGSCSWFIQDPINLFIVIVIVHQQFIFCQNLNLFLCVTRNSNYFSTIISDILSRILSRTVMREESVCRAVSTFYSMFAHAAIIGGTLMAGNRYCKMFF